MVDTAKPGVSKPDCMQMCGPPQNGARDTAANKATLIPIVNG
jgi:hypothetical protein